MARNDVAPADAGGAGLLDRLARVIDHAAHLLPAQGPITVFIHHNTLHAFEDLPFERAVVEGARVFGCRAYLPESRYREHLRRGRIRASELRQVVAEGLGPRASEKVAGLSTLAKLRTAMLVNPLSSGPAAELSWFIAETGALRRMRSEASAASRYRIAAETRRWALRDLRGRPEWAALFEGADGRAVESWDEAAWEAFALRALWRVCREGVRSLPSPAGSPPPVRHRDLLLAVGGPDADLPVHDVLVRFCAAFLDQGVSHWQLPDRQLGLFRSFCSFYGESLPPGRWAAGLAAELRRLRASEARPLAVVAESLEALGVPEAEWDEFLSPTLLALRGWAGMVRQLEERGDRVALSAPAGSLVEFLAVRLILERLSLAHALREAGVAVPLAGAREELRRRLPPAAGPGLVPRAFTIFQLAQILGWTPEELHRLGPTGWAELIGAVEEFSSTERQRTFHLAFERRLRTQALDAIALHPSCVPPEAPPRFQLICCLDEREESFRRHVEEVAPDCETFGAAGFFGVAMYYRGVGNAHFVPLCPVMVRPRHFVEERPEACDHEEHQSQVMTRKAVGATAYQAHVGTRSFALGALLTAGLGVLASVPLVARILFPRLTARVRGLFGRVVWRKPRTTLRLERSGGEPAREEAGQGYTAVEMADIAERQLRDIGLTRRFARLVLILGHGSNSLNNPHKSAYDCGACGGNAGEPNARALARMLNDPRVRAELARRGLPVPGDTHFVGGFHNTCDDSVSCSDLESLPESHGEEFARVRRDLEEACDRNAHERCRRFMSAPLTLTPTEARRHVEARSEDLAQTRPELGHATNALCLVGRRDKTRGLYFDRRAFLVSYDPTQDGPDCPILTRILAAAVPVCGGINLEYYFSHVDSPGWGCGSKLPHNVTSLLGVMDGAASDLRTGLPWQMVEIHEPVRLLFVVEATPAALNGIMDRNEVIGRMCRNGWVQLTSQDPETGELRVYQNGEFRPYTPEAVVLPRADSSAGWYRGWRDHLEFAEVGG